jgi:hypothetical protein
VSEHNLIWGPSPAKSLRAVLISGRAAHSWPFPFLFLPLFTNILEGAFSEVRIRSWRALQNLNYIERVVIFRRR